MAQNITRIKDTNDVLAPKIHVWHRLEDAARRIFSRYGYEEIRTPIFERTELFQRAIGEETDVVSKEMYTFDDEGTSVTLRPEGTAPVVRAFVQNGLHIDAPRSRLWYLGPMFRREHGQKGRYRQFWQIGAELFGETSPRSDAEVLTLLRDVVDDIGLRGVVVEISSLGDEACRGPYRPELQTYLRSVADKLCDDCKRRIETNPLRVLDCKNPKCRAATANAPLLLEKLCEPCKTHFEGVKRNLDTIGVKYEVNPRIVRGLDYYMRTAFELIHRPTEMVIEAELAEKARALPAGAQADRVRERLSVDGKLRVDEAFLGELREGTKAKGDAPRVFEEILNVGLGSQNAVGGGGRYDGLVKSLGGGPIAGIGFGLGLERLVLALQSQGTVEPPMLLAWIAALGPEAQDEAVKLAAALRAIGVRVQLGFDAKEKQLPQQMEAAKKRGAQAVVIIGAAELAKRVAQVKDLAAGTQVEVSLEATAIAAALARIG